MSKKNNQVIKENGIKENDCFDYEDIFDFVFIFQDQKKIAKIIKWYVYADMIRDAANDI